VSADDPVAAAIARATDDLPEADAGQVAELVRRGLADIDPVVGPEDLAVEVDAALDVPPADRVVAARRFAAHRRAVRLGRTSWELLRAFTAGTLADREASTRARELLADVEAAIDDAPDDGARRELGDYALEARYVLAGGAGPISLRGAKLTP
jgi:hypothetical protein